MATINQFKDLEDWKGGPEITHVIYNLTNDGNLDSDGTLKDQIWRSAYRILSPTAQRP